MVRTLALRLLVLDTREELNVEKERIIQIVGNLLSAVRTEKEEEKWIEELKLHVPYSNEIFRIITTETKDLSPEEIVNKAIASYKPILL